MSTSILTVLDGCLKFRTIYVKSAIYIEFLEIINKQPVRLKINTKCPYTNLNSNRGIL